MRTLGLLLLLAVPLPGAEVRIDDVTTGVLKVRRTPVRELAQEVRDEVYQANIAALKARVDEEKAHALYRSKIAEKERAVGLLAAAEAKAREICRAGGGDFDAKAVKCVEVNKK